MYFSTSTSTFSLVIVLVQVLSQHEMYFSIGIGKYLIYFNIAKLYITRSIKHSTLCIIKVKSVSLIIIIPLYTATLYITPICCLSQTWRYIEGALYSWPTRPMQWTLTVLQASACYERVFIWDHIILYSGSFNTKCNS